MLINLSNHPISKWSSNQIYAASKYGEIKDLSFPIIDPLADTKSVYKIVKDYEKKILEIFNKETGIRVVHLMGELSFCFMLADILKKEKILCVVSTTKRIVQEYSNGNKTSRFEFIRFRNYW